MDEWINSLKQVIGHKTLIRSADIDKILQKWSWIGNYNQARRMGGVSTEKPIIGLMYISSVKGKAEH
jgi:hypothetical protein